MTTQHQVTAQDEVERLTALHELEILDTPREERFDRVVRLAQRLFNVPMVAISLVDQDRQWHKANAGLGWQEAPRTEAFCNRTIQQAGPYVVPDAKLDPDYATNSLVQKEPAIRFYAGQPLAAPGGQLVGTLCILDEKPREISPVELALLRDLADWVEKEMSIDEELVRASEVQRRLLPHTAPSLPGYEVAGHCLTARKVGGDFFDWFAVGDDFQFVLADVMGKGVAAALIGATVRAVVRGASRFNDLGEAINRASATLEQDLADTDTFTTLFCARLDTKSHRLRYVDAGHGLSFLVGRDGTTRRLASDGLPLGVSFGDELQVHEMTLAPGDTLVAVSDGFLDFYPTAAEALQAARAIYRSATSAEDLVQRLCRVAGSSPPPDDVTVVAMRRSG
jgi:hypothetical protein